MPFQITILGAVSAIPTTSKAPTAQVVSANQSLYLIDCAEGTQVQMRKYGVKMQRIGAVFISHMHGDHYFGLIGLLNTMSLLGRDKPLQIFGPPQLKDIINLQFKAAKTRPSFYLEFNNLEFGNSVKIFEDQQTEVFTIPLDHRIPCNGFLFKEKTAPLKILKEKIDRYNVPIEKIKEIKRGSDYKMPDGKIIPNSKLTAAPPPPHQYAYCSDTKYNERIIPIIKNSELLYHEATFTNGEAQRAADTFHSTAAQAAAIAQKANVKKLIIGHYSARYKNTDLHLNEANAIFENTFCAQQGEVYCTST